MAESKPIEDLTVAELVVAGPVNVRGILVHNGVASVVNVQLFDAAESGDVTLGTTAPNIVVPLAASSVVHVDLTGVPFSLGLVAAATTDFLNDTAAASGVNVTFIY
jgi:hypothetical protein